MLVSAGWEHPVHSPSVFAPGSNCWRIEHADRVAVLVDAAAYFEAFVAACERAQHSILIVGWDIDSRTRLLPHAHPRHYPTDFGDFLNAIVARRKDLHAYLLGWDFHPIYALEREWLPTWKLGKRTHARVHFQLDAKHVLYGSHHQKIVVIDDRIAFSGGLDLTVRRWDTRDHLPNNPLRVDPAGEPYKPFHDVQVMLTGDAARALGELARERWWRATGERLAPPPAAVAHTPDPWPATVRADFTQVPLAISRTQPALDDTPQTCEVRQLFWDMIARARRHIYIENQYFTSDSVGRALAARLQEPHGPEVAIVLPRGNSGWLEENTMGILRARIMRELKHADRHGRLRIFYAAVTAPETTYVQIHSKVTIIDDEILRIGSANLNNRSMGMDTECDIALAANGDTRIENGIARIRNELLAEHLGATADEVAQAHARHGSLVAAIDGLRGREHTLLPLTGELAEDVTLPEPLIFDPERPVPPEKIISELVPSEVRRRAKFRYVRHILVLLAVLSLAAAWRLTPLASVFDLDTVTRWADTVSAHPLGPVAVIAGYVVGGLVLFPVTVLIVATAFAFDPLPAFVYALTGCLLSALAGYRLGRLLGKDALRRIAGPKLERLNKRLIKRGLITIMTVRMVPVAPFSVINVAAGALRLRARDLILGTALGMTPGILGITLFTGGLAALIREPSLKSLAVLAVIALVIGTTALWLRRWLAQPDPERQALAGPDRRRVPRD